MHFANAYYHFSTRIALPMRSQSQHRRISLLGLRSDICKSDCGNFKAIQIQKRLWLTLYNCKALVKIHEEAKSGKCKFKFDKRSDKTVRIIKCGAVSMPRGKNWIGQWTSQNSDTEVVHATVHDKNQSNI